MVAGRLEHFVDVFDGVFLRLDLAVILVLPLVPVLQGRFVIDVSASLLPSVVVELDRAQAGKRKDEVEGKSN
ncbi:MAG: hypothetical protein BWY75_01353 [bacterium ADurb.Bin425]|nr:MAG: hypothetical protein BWY75_01353 [bacterium ADurb.Bin425]